MNIRDMSKGQLRRLQQERERQAYLSRLSYNDAQERGAEHCNDCGDTDPWFPRCKEHEPIE